MKKPLTFIACVVLIGVLLYWSRFDLEYGVVERGVFTQTQVLRRDNWRWEGTVTDLKYYEVCRRTDGLCWRRLPDRSFWVDDTPSYDSPYIAIVANNRNGQRVETEFRFFETLEGAELPCRNCDLGELIRSEGLWRLYITGDIAWLGTAVGPTDEYITRLRLLDLSEGAVYVHHLADIDPDTRRYGWVYLYPDPVLRAGAWIVCTESGCTLYEYHIDSGDRLERAVDCTPGPSAKLYVRVANGAFVPDCE